MTITAASNLVPSLSNQGDYEDCAWTSAMYELGECLNQIENALIKKHLKMRNINVCGAA